MSPLIKRHSVQQIVRMLLLLHLQYLADVLVNIIRRFDGSGQIKDSFACYECFFLIISDLDVDHMNRSIEFPSSG